MKTQMKVQKILTLSSLVFAALVLVYAFFYCSGMLYGITFYENPQFTSAPNHAITGLLDCYDYTQSMNDVLVIFGIVLLVSVVLLYVTATNRRRRYYITNYIAIGIVVVAAIAYAILLLVVVCNTLALCSQVNLTEWQYWYNYKNRYGTPYHWYYSEDVSMVYVGIAVSVLLIVFAAAWVLNLLWKIKLMRGEKELLANGLVKEVA